MTSRKQALESKHTLKWLDLPSAIHSHLAWLWYCGRFPDRSFPYSEIYGTGVLEDRKAKIGVGLSKDKPSTVVWTN